ncbi:MAG: VanW family protein [bacterium]|nr:VanW family protein [bacterium]
MKRFYFFYIFTVFLFAINVSPVKAAQELVLSIGGQKETVSYEQMRNWISIEPSLKIDSEKRSEIENIRYCPTDRLFCRLVFGIRKMAFLKKETKISADNGKIEEFLSILAKKFDKDPIDAKFKIEDNGLANFAVSQEGRKLNIPKGAELIAKNISENISFQETQEIPLPFETIEPEIKSSEAANFGITSLIGEGASNFRGSPKNRIFNINAGTEKFNGVLIKPGEDFSFVKTLGPVDGEHGYAPELVIKKDRTEPEFGGGICQVSTTAFRAAINSGLQITARRNHAYPVAYYNPQGMDATVYIPKPDLRFINNTPRYILIQTKIEGTVLTFQFYGTNDGRKIEIDGPTILSRESDGSMKTTFTQKVFDKDGSAIINDVFNSNYESPSKFPHPGQDVLTQKPKNWSSNEWKTYQKTHGN